MAKGTVEERLTALEKAVAPNVAAKADRQRRAAEQKAERERYSARAALAISEAIKQITPEGWELLDDDLYADTASNAREAAAKEFGETHLVQVVPGFSGHVWHATDETPVKIVRVSHQWVVFGRPRAIPLGHKKCSHCKGLGIVRASRK